VQQEFIVKTVANDDAGRMVRAYFDIPAGVAVEYQEQNPDHPDYGKWFPLEGVFGPSTGFPVMNVDDSRFRATFDTAGDYSITIEFKEVGTDEVLATYVMNVTAVVETIAAEVDYTAVWNGDRGTWYIKVTVPGEDLDNGSVESIKAIKEAGAELSEPRELTPDTDKVMWFGVAKGDGDTSLKTAGEYAYEVVRKDGTKYIFNFTYAPGSVTGATNLVQAALAAVNAITGTAADIEVITDNAEILGLELEAFEALDDETGQDGGRQTAVMKDLVSNKPSSGYDQDTLKAVFDSIVAVRTATQASMDLVNEAESLENIAYVEDLLNAFKGVADGHTIHSGKAISDKVTELEDLVADFEALPETNQEAALQAVITNRPEGGYLRSQSTLDALANAIAEQEGIVGDVNDD
jgi:hypothetical protein